VPGPHRQRRCRLHPGWPAAEQQGNHRAHQAGPRRDQPACRYLLLDYHEKFGINRVGLHLSRQGTMIIWTVSDFLRLLGATMPLAELPLRQRLHAVSTFGASASTRLPRVAAMTPYG